VLIIIITTTATTPMMLFALYLSIYLSISPLNSQAAFYFGLNSSEQTCA
jgi:hypothetical protein